MMIMASQSIIEEANGEAISAHKRMEDKVPIIDFAGLQGEQREVVCRQIAEACETWGFFQAVNHGLDPELMKQAKEVSKEFFYLPEGEKLKIKVGPSTIQGWNHPKLSKGIGDSKLINADTVEHLHLVQTPDTQETAERYPMNPPGYRPTILGYAEKVGALHEMIIGILLEMLGLPPEVAKTRLQREKVSMRTNFYALREEGGEPVGVCHPHSDPGGLTILLADDVPGLEVKKDGRWVPVDPVPGAFTINVGDAIEIISNGRYKSVEHRGSPHFGQERLTMAAFWSPSVVGPLKELINDDNPPLYKTCSYGSYSKDFVKRGLDGKNGVESFKL